MADAQPAAHITLMTTAIRIGQELSTGWLWVIGTVVLLAGIRTFVAAGRGGVRHLRWLAVAGYVSLAFALLRPELVTSSGRLVEPRIAVLIDASQRLNIATERGTHLVETESAIKALRQHFRRAQLSLFALTGGKLTPLPLTAPAVPRSVTSSLSDLEQGSQQLAAGDAAPSALVVVSDGRLRRPDAAQASTNEFLPPLLRQIPIHSVVVGVEPVPDLAIRAVSAVNQAVAHQPFVLRIQVSCTGGLHCNDVPVTVREFRKGQPAKELARADARWEDRDHVDIDVEVVFDRVGTHVIGVGVDHHEGDRVPENDERIIPVSVVRNRVRLLHIAGAPSYDVRELRRWLKSSASLDLVSFFILRTDDDDTNVLGNTDELSLIPFPVDELFDQHLPSFDGVILQNINAPKYHLDRHLQQLARYVEKGGGLILLGGNESFGAGGYARSPLERVMPAAVIESPSFDTAEFTPDMAPGAMVSPILAPLQAVVGQRLPSFPGANLLAAPAPGTTVLWSHPQRRTAARGAVGDAMPVLAVREVFEGRTVALAIDASYRLAWGSEGADSAGRAYGALWEALVGWVTREPRFEAFRGVIDEPCVQGAPCRIRWMLPPAAKGHLDATISPLSDSSVAIQSDHVTIVGSPEEITIASTALHHGAYEAVAKLTDGRLARLAFGCELGGEAYTDTRPDPSRLQKLSEATGGVSVSVEHISNLPIPTATSVDDTRTSKPLGAAWLWSLFAALCLGLFWMIGRSRGLH